MILDVRMCMRAFYCAWIVGLQSGSYEPDCGLASVEAKHMIIAALVDRIEIGENYEVHIHFKVSAEQFIRQTA